MVARNRRCAFAIAAMGLLFVAVPILADDTPPLPRSPKPNPVVDFNQLRTNAALAEKRGKWDEAVGLYLTLYEQQKTPELRERIFFCLKNSKQISRQRDPVFQQFVLSLSVAESLNLYTEVLGRLSTIYFDRDRSTAAKLFSFGLDEFTRALANAEFRTANLEPTAEAKLGKFQRSLRDEWRTKLPENPREARHAVREIVLEANQQLGILNPSAIVFEFLCGACTGLDEYTLYVSPATSEFPSPVLELASYGILVRVAPSELFVDAVIPNSWASFHTTLKKGDRITRVNSRAIDANMPNSAGQALRDPSMAGHELEITTAENPIAAVNVRLPVPLATVFGGEMLKEGVAYLRLAAFKETTPREFDEALMSLKARGMRVLVLDFRGNPGGLFPAALQVAQRLLPSVILVTTQGQSPEFSNRIFSSDAGMNALDFPLVLLVDTKTMSSAEAVAVSWKDHGRATLVGLPTFGKGVIQSPIRLQSVDRVEGTRGRSGMLILTVATMQGPRGLTINGTGVVPDVLEVDPIRQYEAAITKALELLKVAMPSSVDLPPVRP